MRPITLSVLWCGCLLAADPTFLRRHIPSIEPKPDDLTAGGTGALYRPAFGAGDADARHLKGIARYGELTVQPGGASALVTYDAEEQIYVVLDGQAVLRYEDEESPLKRYDFLYLPPGVRHGVLNRGSQPVRLLVMGYRIPPGTLVVKPSKLEVANIMDVAMTPLAGHGPTTQFRLLMGTTESKRDRIAAASQMTSLFVMDFAPGGTNIPHHHETEEEIYYVLQGSGDMVAGGGADGNEGRYASRAGDVWFLRLNATVGFYSAAKPGEPHDMVLAVRSRFPFPKPR